MRILVINGPNLNLLGKREPQIYGTTSLWEIENGLKEKFPAVKFEFYQSSIEGELVNYIQKGIEGGTDGIVLNPGAYGHTSYAMRDAVSALKIPVVEVHLSNVHAREEFRRNSVIAPVCKGVITGFGAAGYELAVRFLADLNNR
jgi:3-dehydroquinate dehydratase-2